jgi:hypothetical protein
VGQRMMETYNIGNDRHESEQPGTSETAEPLGKTRCTEANNDSDRGQCRKMAIYV